ncbi:phospholipase A [Thauera chlorobenzoica]|nr:phospholipase A [Thauera chlorobenzoica]
MNPFRALSDRARTWGVAVVLAWGCQAQAAGWLLASQNPSAEPGGFFSVIVIRLPGADELPDRISGVVELSLAGPQIALELTASEQETSGQRRYVGRWPQEAVGVATLTLRDVPTARMLIEAGTSPVAVALSARQQASGRLQPGTAPEGPTIEPAQPNALGFHEPMYFLLGGNDPRSARFQFSFRYRLFDDQGMIAENFPVVRGLYFGFTQTSLWDLDAHSKPFRDTSFRPSLFYRWRLSTPENGGWMAFSGGYEHESNGKDGADSRSIDMLFLRAEARRHFSDGRTYMGIAPKVWAYLDKEDNPDIAEYRGYGELEIRFGRDDGLMLSGLLRRGSAGKTSAQLDLSYPLRRSIFSGVGAFVHLQYFRGHGETLIDYSESRGSQFRLGVSLVR